MDDSKDTISLDLDQLLETKKNDLKLNQEIVNLVQAYKKSHELEQRLGGGATIHVDEIASRVAAFYEKIRQVVDWKEEHYIRRGSIERILKRSLISELSGIHILPNLKPEEIAEPLVLELVRGGHFPNDLIPQERIEKVRQILVKYYYLLEHNPLHQTITSHIKRKINFYNWILELAACEIEEALDPSIKENSLIVVMTNLMNERIQIKPANKITSQEKLIQTYIAVHRALFQLDASIISYHLLCFYYPAWRHLTQEQLEDFNKNIFEVWERLERDLAHPLGGDFYKICEKYDTIYLVLGDVLNHFSKEPETITKKVSSPQLLEVQAREAYKKRLSTLKSRLFRMAVYSTLSIFIAGAFTLFVVEFPLAKLIYGHWGFLAMIVDLLEPSFFMFFLVALVKLPPASNLDRVITEIIKVVYQQESKDVYEVVVEKKKSHFFKFITFLLYVWATIISISITAWFFYLARIPVTSIILDTFNMAMIVFAALVVRQRARELTVEEKVSVWEFFLDIISVPLGQLGQWLSAKWREYNIVSVFFTALVDMPISNFISFIENWSSFLKERKSRIH